jgi:hypothetical protein
MRGTAASGSCYDGSKNRSQGDQRPHFAVRLPNSGNILLPFVRNAEATTSGDP